MKLTVAIPSRGRNQALCRLLAALEGQTLPGHRFEVLVGLDGEASPVSHPRATFLHLPHRGPAATRNALIAGAKAPLILFLNDDVIPDAGLLEAHLRVHGSLRPADLVLGSAPWATHGDDTLFDRLIRETSLVFFYDAMTDADPGRDWGFRHAWTLNLSLRTDLARRFPFDERLTRAMFEDLEWAWRLARYAGSRVLYRPEARVTHDHRYTPGGYLQRERALGAQALALAEVNGPCARDIFRDDVRSAAFVRKCERESTLHAELCARLEPEFYALADRAAGTSAAVGELYQRFLPLKRRAWRQGLIAAARELGLASTCAA